MSSINPFHKFDLNSRKSFPLLENSPAEKKVSVYASCLEEAISAINIMIAFLTPTDPDLVQDFIDRKKQLAADLDIDPQSHVQLWKDLVSIASDLQSAILQSSQWQEKKIETGELEKKTEDLEKKLNSDDLDFDEWKNQMARIQRRTTTQQAKNIFFEKTKKAFKYFQEAVKAFAQCGVSLLKNSGSDMDWLDDATIVASRQLSQKK
jgi:hypothetical protein